MNMNNVISRSNSRMILSTLGVVKYLPRDGRVLLVQRATTQQLITVTNLGNDKFNFKIDDF